MAETKAIGSVRLAHAALTRNRAIAFLAVVGPVVASGAGLTVVWQRGLIGPMEIGLFAFFYLLAGLGITLGFHRLFSHRSFVASQPLEAALAIAGSLTVQGPIIRWVADHRRHHRFSDRPGIPTARTSAGRELRWGDCAASGGPTPAGSSTERGLWPGCTPPTCWPTRSCGGWTVTTSYG